jgi:hypothetical protein
MAAVSPKPSLVKPPLTKGQTLSQRLQALLPTTITQYSPITVYAPAGTPGGQLSAPTTALPNVGGWYGVFTAPDLNNGQPYQVQVEAIAGGGGGGGGVATIGGGGGGGGGYSCEPNYTLSPNVAYTYICGLPGSPGSNNPVSSSGVNGGDTIFDVAGLVLPTGVHAYGGQAGDIGSPGVGGPGGVTSSNTISYAGGMGGTGYSGLGSDNPMTLATISGMFTLNTLNPAAIKAWYLFNDATNNTFRVNDNSLHDCPMTVVDSNSGGFANHLTTSPTQVPAYAAAVDLPSCPNAQVAGMSGGFRLGKLTQYSARLTSSSFPMNGSHLTISGWIQCDPTGVWGNTAASSYAVIAANTGKYNGNAMVGYALFIVNDGTATTPKWDLFAAVGNGTSRTLGGFNITSLTTPGSWIYVVMTYSSGTLKLYVNGVLEQTISSSGYTSVPAGFYTNIMGMDPGLTENWYFGFMSGFWFAEDAATATLVNTVYSSTAPTGGSGGGASGSPGGVGGVGQSASGVTGGAGGIAVAIPANLTGFTTAGANGISGANASSSNSQAIPAGPGSGGGGSGDMAASPNLFTLTVPFSSAATYCGPDAIGGNAGALYNANQQITSGQQSVGALFAGGQATDPATGSKNSMLLLPAGYWKNLGSGKWTIQQVAITFTNAFQSSSQETILELSYSADTSLPVNYLGASVVEYIGSVLIPAGSTSVTYDLTPSGIGAVLQSGAATAILLGPTDNPTFDAYNAATATDFYCSIYGVGATDSGGNSLQPYLTITLQETLTTQVGSYGAGGVIRITDVAQGTPVATLEPFATSDSQGNQFAAGYTGPTSAWNPSLAAPNMAPDTWHTVGGTNAAGSSYQSGFSIIGNAGQPLQFMLGSDGNVYLNGAFNCASGTATGGQNIFIMPSAWRPNRTCYFHFSIYPLTTANIAGEMWGQIGTNGQVSCNFNTSATTITAVLLDTYYPLVSNVS